MSSQEASSSSAQADSEQPPKRRTPLPLVQLSIILLIQFTEPLTATVVYPFVPQFIRDTGITGGDEKKVGYYAGIIESTFFVSESLSVYYWAILSDRFGRRPTLLFAPFGLAMSMLGFGSSTTFWSLVFFRLAQGVFNGNIGVSKTMVAEITDSSNIADAFSYAPIMWGGGIVLGPLLGGTFSNPSSTWPNTFGKIALLRAHPYLLPCALAAIVCIICLAFAYVILEESGPRHKKTRDSNDQKRLSAPEEGDVSVPDYGSTTTSRRRSPTPTQRETNQDHEKPLNFLELLKHRRVAITMTCYAFLAFCDMCYSALVPLIYSTSIEGGGLGLRPDQIGRIMASYFITAALLQTLVFSKIMRRFGNRNCFIGGLVGLFGALCFFPLVTFLARRKGGIADASVIVALIGQLFFASFNFMAYSSIMVLIVDSAPSKASLSTTNGLGQVVATAARALGPTVASSLFSLSLQHNLLGGNFVHVVNCLILLVGIRVAFWKL